MKRIYLILAMLLGGVFSSSTLMAQSALTFELDEDNPLITDASQLSSPWSDPDQGKNLGDLIDGNTSTFWHSSWHDNPPHRVQGSHYFQVEMPEDYYESSMTIAFRFTRRDNTNNQITQWTVKGTNDELVTDVNNPMADKDQCETLAEVSTPLGANNETLTSTAFDPKGYKYLRFYCEATKGVSQSNLVFFHLSEFQLYPTVKLSEIEAAARELEAIYMQYQKYYDNADYFPVGEKPGDFSEDAVTAFRDAYEAAETGAFESDDVEEMKKLGEDLIAAYEAIWPTRRPIVLENGYYRLRTAMKYYQMEAPAEEEPEEKVYYTKYMRAVLDANGTTINARWGTPEDLDTDASALWKVTRQESGNYDFLNTGYEVRFDTVKTSAQVTLSKEANPEMVITALFTNEDDQTYVNINLAEQPDAEKNRQFLHQNGHGANNGEGTNKENMLVGWSSTFELESRAAGASEWIFEPVSEEEAQKVIEGFQVYKNREVMLVAYDSIMANAQANVDLALDLIHETLITDVSQLSSPYTEPKEGSIAALIDGDTSSFWHSNYSDGSVEGGTHYLQVDLINPVDVKIYAMFTRRPCQNDHVTQMAIMGTNDPEAAKAACEELLVWDTPYGNNTESFTSQAFDAKDYRYLRFYANTTTNNRGFWHISEFQLGYDMNNPKAQANNMGEVFTKLQTVIEKYKDLEHDNVTVDIYNELKAAYDAFMEKFVDPSILRNTLAELNGTDAKVVTGKTWPGYWKSDADAKAFKNLYAEASAYDKEGAYKKEQSQGYIDQLTALKEKIDDPNATYPVQAGKWYRIRFASKELYTENSWETVAGDAIFNKNIDRNTNEELFDKVAAAAICKVDSATYDNEGTEAKVAYNTIEETDLNNLGVGDKLHFIYNEDLREKDMALFRFVAVGDSAYMLQNKATGLFVRAAGSTGAATLSAQPTLFTTEAVGYGMNYIAARKLTDGTKQNYLHSQVQQNVLVTYSANTDVDSKRCSFFLEEVADVEANYDGTEFNMPLQYGAITPMCFPVEIAPVKGQRYELWSVNSVESNKLTMNKIEGTVVAGRPFIAIVGSTEDYLEGEAAEMYTMKKGYDLVTEPQTNNTLKGTFDAAIAPAGALIAKGNAFEVVKFTSTATNVGINSAYISTEEGFDKQAEVEVVWDKDAEDGIETALANVSKAGAVYDLNGRLVSRKATLNEISNFGKGIYILNGTKVIVK